MGQLALKSLVHLLCHALTQKHVYDLLLNERISKTDHSQKLSIFQQKMIRLNHYFVNKSKKNIENQFGLKIPHTLFSISSERKWQTAAVFTLSIWFMNDLFSYYLLDLHCGQLKLSNHFLLAFSHCNTNH